MPPRARAVLHPYEYPFFTQANLSWTRWTIDNVLVPVTNQLGYRSCWASVLCALLSAKLVISGYTERPIPLSIRQLFELGGERGLSQKLGLELLRQGVVSENAYPYYAGREGEVPPPRKDPPPVCPHEDRYGVESYFCIQDRSLENVINHLRRQPLSGTIMSDFRFRNCTENKFRTEPSIFDDVPRTPEESEIRWHAVFIIGHHRIGSIDYFILQGTWGTDWAWKGFVKVNVVLVLSRPIWFIDRVFKLPGTPNSKSTKGSNSTSKKDKDNKDPGTASKGKKRSRDDVNTGRKGRGGLVREVGSVRSGANCQQIQAEAEPDNQVWDVRVGWSIVWDEESKQEYYWNLFTGETSWEVPDVLLETSVCVEGSAEMSCELSHTEFSDAFQFPKKMVHDTCFESVCESHHADGWKVSDRSVHKNDFPAEREGLKKKRQKR